MPEIQDFGVTVDEQLDGVDAGSDIFELRRLETSGIPTDLALELMAIMPKVANGTASPEEIVRGLRIMSPSRRKELD